MSNHDATYSTVQLPSLHANPSVDCKHFKTLHAVAAKALDINHWFYLQEKANTMQYFTRKVERQFTSVIILWVTVLDINDLN